MRVKVSSACWNEVYTGPLTVGRVYDPCVRLPGAGVMDIEAQPGASARIPNRSHGMIKPGALAHGWLQVKFGFSSRVHISIVVVAPCRRKKGDCMSSNQTRLKVADGRVRVCVCMSLALS